MTAASCLAHLWLAAGNQHGTWLNLLMLAMVAVCLPCAVHIWRHGRASALRQVMASALAMTGVHAVLLLGAGPAPARATATTVLRRPQRPGRRRPAPGRCWRSSRWK